MDLDHLRGSWLNDEFPTWQFGDREPLVRDAFDTACNRKPQSHDENDHLHRMILCKRDIDMMRNLPEDQWDGLAPKTTQSAAAPHLRAQ